MKPRSLRLNLILWFTFVFTLILFLSDYVTYNAIQKILLSELDSSLISTAALESASLRDEDATDIKAISNRPNQYARFVRQFVQVLDGEGRVTNQSGVPESTGPLIDKSQLAAALGGSVIAADGHFDGSSIRLAAVGAERNGLPFAVVVGTRSDSGRNIASRIALILLVIDIVAVAASIMGGYLIIGKALKPVDHIAERARHIGQGNLRQRLEYMDSSSEMVRLTAVLNEMLDKLQRLFESQEQFVQDASHEIRSPLAALRCRLEVALRQDRPPEDYRQVIEGSLEDATRLTALADDLFLLARADSNNLSMEFREVSLAEVLAGIHAQLMPLAESQAIDFTLDAGPNSTVYADRTRIAQAFRNLAENALKYTPRGGRVAIRVKPEGEDVRADIEDTGIGIPQEEHANIFRRFYRVDHARSRSDGGTGLGLAICDQIVRAHGGRIEVDSAPGGGSRFSVYLASATALLERATS
ncbi:MAG TPA: ATP-binding protein [Blastocatellia bacterium]|jgi:heavy metal sensor kinase|nr:ATP-binding protein [Blastocatellia bacterium]